jgi:hypothetical protein
VAHVQNSTAKAVHITRTIGHLTVNKVANMWINTPMQGRATLLPSLHNARKAPPSKAKGLPINDVYVANIPKGNTVPDTLTGEYLRHGSKLNGPCTLLLVHRGTTTTAKAHTFALLVHPDGKRSYVSSVWDGPTAGTYALEYRGIRYTLTLAEGTASMVPATVGTPPYINRGSGNSIAA